MPLLEMKNISKSFFGVCVLKNVKLEIETGSVHALMGENGAGKSTMMKILVGLYKSDSGQILIDGQTISITSPAVAQHSGIAMIHQELSPVPELPVAQNIFLGREPGKFGFIDYKALYKKTNELFKRLNITHIDPKTKIGTLKVADQQLVEIAKAISLDARIIVMDEPTSAITDREVENLFAIIRDLRAQGKSIIYISHKMDEVFEICDSITVLRDGNYIGSWKTKNLSRNELIKQMVGRELTEVFPKKQVEIKDLRLKVEKLSRENAFKNISFDVRKGEILGIAGLVGAGRSEVMQALFGVKNADSGTIEYEGNVINISSPIQAMNHGIAFVTEDRKGEGLFLEQSISNNISIAYLKNFQKAGLLDKEKETAAVEEKMKALRVKCNSRKQRVGSLSGGNQQKVVLAKWLLRKPRLLILDEPTRGIDVGAKSEIYRLMGDYVDEGNSIIMISSEMPEVMGLSDRIVVFSNGTVAGVLNRDEFNQEAIMRFAVSMY